MSISRWFSSGGTGKAGRSNEEQATSRAARDAAAAGKTPAERTKEDVDTVVKHTRPVPFFAELPTALHASICRNMRLRSYEPGSAVYIEGGHADRAFLVLKGGVRVDGGAGARIGGIGINHKLLEGGSEGNSEASSPRSDSAASTAGCRC